MQLVSQSVNLSHLMLKQWNVSKEYSCWKNHASLCATTIKFIEKRHQICNNYLWKLLTHDKSSNLVYLKSRKCEINSILKIIMIRIQKNVEPLLKEHKTYFHWSFSLKSPLTNLSAQIQSVWNDFVKKHDDSSCHIEKEIYQRCIKLLHVQSMHLCVIKTFMASESVCS